MLKRLDHSSQRCDVVASPTTALPPPRLGWIFEDAAADPLSPLIPRSAMAAPFTALYNITGQPAATWPLDWTDRGLPVGVPGGGADGR